MEAPRWRAGFLFCAGNAAGADGCHLPIRPLPLYSLPLRRGPRGDIGGSGPLDDLPRLLADFPRLPGEIKADYEDFQVEELPLYPLSGEGDHTYFLLEKRGLNTVQAVHDIAFALDRPRRDFGYAGMKDARAVTRQWISIEHCPPEALQQLQIPRLQIREVTRHRNKIKLGHLRGNRFTIRVRKTATDRLRELQEALEQLVQRGVPNYFGPQRFGMRGDNADVGYAVLKDDYQRVLDLVLGKPGAQDFGEILRARQLYDEGKYEQARNRWPGMFRDQRRALKILAQTGKAKRAFLAFDRDSLRFYVSAYQSALFNRVVAQRLVTGLDKLLLGDLAFRHIGGAVFRVEDVAKEQPRADVFEISPSGPLFGLRMTAANGAPGELEEKILVDAGVTLADFASRTVRAPGGRRPLRFCPTGAQVQLGADERGPYFELQFELPRGSYATALLRELFGVTSADGSDWDGAAE